MPVVRFPMVGADATMTNDSHYSVPSMRDIAAQPWNGLNAISTFSGCGGSTLGYKMAGFRVLWASEFVEAARDTYLANFPDTQVDGRDIRDVTADEVLAAIGLRQGELDVFDGSPPCASFSAGGRGHKLWGSVKKYSDVSQRTDDLFFEYARLLEGLQPRAFVAENVSGLLRGASKGYFLKILHRLRGCGYRVQAAIVNAAFLGVPQARKRVIFIGMRNDLGIDPCYPEPDAHTVSVAQALRGVPDCPSKEAFSIARFKIGKLWTQMRKPGTQSVERFQLVRPHWHKPCPTISASTYAVTSFGGVTHPDECRLFSLPELRRLFGCPDDFKLTGSYNQQGERLGRCVPPLMMARVAASVRDSLLALRHDK